MDNLVVQTVFSPFKELSGDGYDFWIVESNGEKCIKLLGFLYDCTGHDIVSYTQSGEIRTLLKKSCRLYEVNFHKSLAEVLQEVNRDIFDFERDPGTNAAMVFMLDLSSREFHYATAGINHLVIRKDTGEFMCVDSPSTPFGYDPDLEYEEEVLSLNGFDRIILPTDGFTELITNGDALPKEDIAKHDDVTAIYLILK